MAAVFNNIICQDRHKLEDVIPLETPYSLAIDPCNLCNFRCNFCAIQCKKEEFTFRQQFMEWDLFVKIIQDLKAFPQKLKVLRINGQGEPMLNPAFPDMLKYAKEQNVAEFIETITNGSRLNPELNQRLIDSGIDRIRISVEALDEEGYQKISGVRSFHFNEFLENIKDLHDRSGNCEIYCKIMNVSVPTEEERERFAKMFGEICDRYFVDNVIPLWSDFEEITSQCVKEGVHGQEIKKVMVCPYPFYSLIINPDGDVTACCADWKRKLVFGNLGEKSLKEIWNGTELRNFWREMLKGNKAQYEMCSKCLLPMYDCNDNIDDYAEDILTRI